MRAHVPAREDGRKKLAGSFGTGFNYGREGICMKERIIGVYPHTVVSY